MREILEDSAWVLIFPLLVSLVMLLAGAPTALLLRAVLEFTRWLR
jgi:hypothetical protein